MERAAGLLLHPTSLPGGHGIGDLGAAAYRWVDFLAAAEQHLWQVLPLGPTGYGDSPYQSFSAFAGNPYLISLDKLVEAGLLAASALADAPAFPEGRVDYGQVIPFKLELLSRAFEHFRAHASPSQEASFERFCEAQRYWLDDYARFMALKDHHDGRPWNAWDEDLRTRKKRALARFEAEHEDAVLRYKVWQWMFYEQWFALRLYANEKGIKIIGDIPIFIAFDSADAWANPELFYFDKAGNPEVVAGVPPDYFSATGQRWGNPLYRWKKMEKRGFAWWIARFRSSLDFYDLIRVDHFRGFESYWEIPAEEPTAERGRWVKGPGQALFDALKAALGELPIIAEDLGIITPEVEKLRDDNALPGMKVLQFAFAADGADPYLPHNYTRNCVVYTGTHDNDTTLGWYRSAPEAERDFVRRYLGRDDSAVPWELIRLAYGSVAKYAIIPLQDVLSLGSEARMNTPGAAQGNWSWRLREGQLAPWVAPALAEMAATYGRVPGQEPEDTPYRQSATEAEVGAPR
ncbi:4-alpha-glucanotransferase [Truepera radiovictrix]|uniref:4-alpha-glucanotransferase n=1 Tax=Truepera radiovictrix (strain DSM 17093 / CIP 108686 / LMG 22925 / RQ-24) TaxID=649638 RepID=D7CSX3_TRURR|nr:4-alpha-glucanotransferase [Truepera radiovictrix]ADI13740.1 4-alpha-glucanotransferase [Truepera radiovictrix DSM 17093]WMT57696.1 4-alpha-glucanotransferase [Truepera radiovictrix]